jgi:hypothetical protein
MYFFIIMLKTLYIRYSISQDFKITGTKDGITATQMDFKVDGLSYEILSSRI